MRTTRWNGSRIVFTRSDRPRRSGRRFKPAQAPESGQRVEPLSIPIEGKQTILQLERVGPAPVRETIFSHDSLPIGGRAQLFDPVSDDAVAVAIPKVLPEAESPLGRIDHRAGHSCAARRDEDGACGVLDEVVR